MEIEIEIDDLTDLDSFFTKIGSIRMHSEWGPKMGEVIVSGSTKWEVFRIVWPAAGGDVQSRPLWPVLIRQPADKHVLALSRAWPYKPRLRAGIRPVWAAVVP